MRSSFAAVAPEFSLSQTMVANHVRALEEALDARLLERTTRRHALTEIGAADLERCRDLLASAQAADHVAEALRTVPQGTWRISAPVSWGTHRLVPVLVACMARHCGVRVELSLDDRVVDLAEEGFDCGFRSGELGDPRLIARPLRRPLVRVAASRACLERLGAPATPRDLAARALLGFTPWGNDPVLRFERAGESVAVPVRGPLKINNGQALLVAAEAGIGIAVPADALLDPAIARGDLVALLPHWQLPSRALHVVRLPEARPSAKLRTFVDFVVERLGCALVREGLHVRSAPTPGGCTGRAPRSLSRSCRCASPGRRARRWLRSARGYSW